MFGLGIASFGLGLLAVFIIWNLYVRFLASPRYSSSKLDSALGNLLQSYDFFINFCLTGLVFFANC